MPPISTPALGDRMGQELGGEPGHSSRSGTHAGASRRCSHPPRRAAAARLKLWLWAAKLPPPVPCPLSWPGLCLSPSLGAARGKQILQAMKEQRISHTHPSSTSLLPSLAALQSLPCTACPGRSRAGGTGTHRDSRANSCPLKRRVSRGPPARDGDPHCHGMETPTAAPAVKGQAGEGGGEGTYLHAVILLVATAFASWREEEGG